METQKLYCTFYLDDLFLGIDVLKVQEILLYQETTPVPLAHPVISGLINLRGQVVTAMDLRLRLGLTPRDPDQLPMSVIVQTKGGTVSLLVDEIGDVVEVQDSAFEPPPETIKGAIRKLINGVYKLDDQLLLVVDAERTMDLSADA